jgi:hypothetical protein
MRCHDGYGGSLPVSSRSFETKPGQASCPGHPMGGTVGRSADTERRLRDRQ